MFTLLAQWTERRARVQLLKADVALRHAQITKTLREAAFVGQAVPAGHAWINDRGIHCIPFLEDPNLVNPYEMGIAHDAESQPPEVDIVSECMVCQQAYAFIGGARQGKSWAAMHVACAWLAAGRRVIVIGAKRRPNEWLGCCRFIGNDPDTLLAGLMTVSEMANQRMTEGERNRIAGDQYPEVLVVLDDWLTTCSILKDDNIARDFIEQAAVVYASQNIAVMSIVHADTATAFNVARVGKGLVEDSLRVHVSKRPDGTREYGVLFPSEKSTRVKGRRLFPQYGFIPSGAPQWPREASGDPSGDPSGDSGGDPPAARHERGKTVGVAVPASWSPEACEELRQAQEAVRRSLPPAPPHRIRVRNHKGNWQDMALNITSAVSVRRAYEVRGSLQAVLKHSFLVNMPGSKTTKREVAKALLGIPSEGYFILS